MKHIIMRREDAEKWLAALRSGAYEKGTDSLEEDGAYCCLGVLQHCLTGQVERIAGTKDVSRATPSFDWLEEHHIRFLNAGGNESPSPWLEAVTDYADGFNDDRESGNDFDLIADVLEAELEFS